MIHSRDVRYHPIVCAICGRDFTGHRRDNGECMVYERTSPEGRPYALRVARVPAAAVGWRVRCG